MNKLVQVNSLQKWYGNQKVIDDVSFSLSSHQKIVIIGPSGSGKSTFIRILAGLESFNDGEINIIGAQKINSSPMTLQTFSNEVGMVFQHFNLFPHLNVLENIYLAPNNVKKIPKKDAILLAENYLRSVQMLEHAHKYPYQLSGGQKQRVAIARALCMQPSIMLFDEPTSALDLEMVDEVFKVIQSLAEQGMSMVIVSHELKFARKIADKIIFMDNGKFIEEAEPNEFFDNPKTERLKRFLKKL